jgi:hypothetical protein
MNWRRLLGLPPKVDEAKQAAVVQWAREHKLDTVRVEWARWQSRSSELKAPFLAAQAAVEEARARPPPCSSAGRLAGSFSRPAGAYPRTVTPPTGREAA